MGLYSKIQHSASEMSASEKLFSLQILADPS